MANYVAVTALDVRGRTRKGALVAQVHARPIKLCNGFRKIKVGKCLLERHELYSVVVLLPDASRNSLGCQGKHPLAQSNVLEILLCKSMPGLAVVSVEPLMIYLLGIQLLLVVVGAHKVGGGRRGQGSY